MGATEVAPNQAPAGKEGGPKGPDAAQTKKFASARELASKLKGMLHRDKNPEAALKNLKDLRESSEAPKKTKSEAWKKATTRSLLRRELSPEAVAWQNNNKDAVNTRYNTLKDALLEDRPDDTDLKPRDRFRLRAQAIADTMKAGASTDGKGKDIENKDKKLTRKAVKNSEAYKKEVSQRLDILTAEKGHKIGKIAEIRVKREVINATLDADRKAAVAKVREEQRVRDEREAIRSHADFQNSVAKEFQKLNPTGEKLSDDKLAELSATAQKNAEDQLLQQKAEAERIAKETAAQQRKDNEAKVIASGEYYSELTRILLDPKYKDDPDKQKTAMDQAIIKMQAREETEAAGGKPDAKAGEPSVDGGSATNAESGSVSGTEAPAAEPTTPEAAAAKTAVETLTAMLKTAEGQQSILAMYKLLNGGKDVDVAKIDTKNDPIWKQIVVLFGTAVLELLKGTGAAIVDGAMGKSN